MTTVSSVTVLVPVTSRGLLIVTSIAVIAILGSAATTCLYLVNTQYSRIGDHWCAVAQIVSEETEDVLHSAELESDKCVERRLQV